MSSNFEMEKIIYTVLIMLFFAYAAFGEGKGILNPVILVPGDGGSQLQAKLDKPSKVAFYCYKKSHGWYDIWLSVNLLFPVAINCLVDNMRLVYDNKTRTTSNSPGVQIRVPGFSETETVEWIDSSHFPGTMYFYDIVRGLVSMGYERNKSIRGAPYDFRKAANEQADYFGKLQGLIENTYSQNSNTSVVLLAHSMGNSMVLYFLNHMTKAWKTKYIKSLISLAGPWGGAVKSLRLMISGDNLDIPIIRPDTVRRQQRTMPSAAWLMPSVEFWQPKEVLVVSPDKNYTVTDFQQLFKDINYTTGYMMYEDTRNLINPLKAPQIPIYCLFGINIGTPGILVYDTKTWRKGFPKLQLDNGDGTVNSRSLYGCLNFQKFQSEPVYLKEFKKVEHMEILRDDNVISEIKKILKSFQEI